MESAFHYCWIKSQILKTEKEKRDENHINREEGENTPAQQQWLA
ncbi:hypothetical protein ACQ3G7_18135 [Kosakonia oryzendophytica]